MSRLERKEVLAMRNLRYTSWLVMAVMLTNFFLYPAEIGHAQAAVSVESAVSGPIDLNKADIEELQAVRGIGPALAERIVDYRTANGKFNSLNDLMAVRGIGASKFEKIKGQVTV